MSKKETNPNRATYSKDELKKATPLRREIAMTTATEWCERWDRVTAAIRKNCGLKEKKK